MKNSNTTPIEKALKWIIPIIQKHHIPYEISGGFAAHIYGATRPVNDIDIDIAFNEEALPKLLPEIKDYITYGPAPYKDEKWDLNLKILLDYEGQLIDIANATDVKIYNEQTQQWQDFSSKFNTSQTKTIFGIEVQVINPKDLIDYKSLLNGDHQKIDIKAADEYLSKMNESQ